MGSGKDDFRVDGDDNEDDFLEPNRLKGFILGITDVRDDGEQEELLCRSRVAILIEMGVASLKGTCFGFVTL
jgi:hypothetical protein